MAKENLRWMSLSTTQWMSSDNKSDYYVITAQSELLDRVFRLRHHISAKTSSQVGEDFSSLAATKAAAEEHYKKEVLR